VAAGDPLWVNGITTAFGSAPPDFAAFAVNSEASVQVAGGSGTAAGTQSCGLASQVCDPASLRVLWSDTGTTTPFLAFSDSGFSINLSSPHLVSAVIRIGPESIDLSSLPASPRVIPTSLPLTSTWAPQYTVGDPTTATTTPTVTSTTSLNVYNSFPEFRAEVFDSMTTASPAVQFEAKGVFNRTTNTFTATSMNLVL
jgi:hypothetical protein